MIFIKLLVERMTSGQMQFCEKKIGCDGRDREVYAVSLTFIS